MKLRGVDLLANKQPLFAFTKKKWQYCHFFSIEYNHQMRLILMPERKALPAFEINFTCKPALSASTR